MRHRDDRPLRLVYVGIFCFTVFASRGVAICAAEGPESEWQAGAASVDITPDYPIRLSGFGSRRTESEGVRQQIWAKALALKFAGDAPALLMSVDNLGIPDSVSAEVGERLKQKRGVDPTRLAITYTHTHTAPMLKGVAPTLYGMPIPSEHQAHIDRYTSELTDKLEQVALEALNDVAPAKLEWGVGKAEFAINRRTSGGPVDHDLPVLVVRNMAGKIRALHISYACHCVTLSENKIGGDWAGYAQEQIEKLHPGAVALISIGCGADQNPRSGVTGDKHEVAEGQGVEVATAVNRVLSGKLRAVNGRLKARYERIELAFDKHPSREEYLENGKAEGAAGYHARVQAERLARGEKLREKIDYPVQSFAFGKSLAMVFLPGEVVVDYSLRLKRELDSERLIVHAYANDAPCYIPSERILREGGYEGGGAMVYYNQPTRLAPGLEQQIVDAVHRQLGEDFAPPEDRQISQGARLKTHADLKAELVASEPFVASPVAIAFGHDRKLWVAEMYDYPEGLDGRFQPGGRIRLLESSRDDGVFDKSTVFLSGIPFPTGVAVWRNGILVCAAPDILYAEDTDGDGKADLVRKLFSGFGTHNYQARVNSLEYGLDGWVYGSCGLFGGTISNDRGLLPVALGDRDFRIKPDDGIIEPATGRTQQGRVRNDWGDWFGCDNSNLAWHYPLADHDLRRNPHFAPERTVVSIPAGPDAAKLFPISTELQTFKLSGPTGRATAACGLGVYRDDLLGLDYQGNLFTCEPVNLVVHRLKLNADGYTFSGVRADNEREKEFVASTDTWFRPVQAKTGPDGGLWIVDMYRYVIEHPRWIPPEQLKLVDPRAGHDRGRIYRIGPADRKLREWPRLDRFSTEQLVQSLDSPNGWQRDMAGQLLAWRGSKEAAPALIRLQRESTRPEVRLAALSVLDMLGELKTVEVDRGLADQHPGVKRHSARLAVRFLNAAPALSSIVVKLLDDEDWQVRLQAAVSLGEWKDQRAGLALAKVLQREAADPIMAAAVFSSLRSESIDAVVSSCLAEKGNARLPDQRLRDLMRSAVALSDGPALSRMAVAATESANDRFELWQVELIAALSTSTDAAGKSEKSKIDRATLDRLAEAIAKIVGQLEVTERGDATRLQDVALVARIPAARQKLLKILPLWLSAEKSPEMQTAAVTALAQMPGNEPADALTDHWETYSPALKTQVLSALMGREAWQQKLLAIVPAAEIDATRRQQLLAAPHASVRELAAKRFNGAPSADRQQVLDQFRDVAKMTGDRLRGKQVFAKSCAVCHRLDNVGHAVGPDLAAVSNKTAPFLLQEILDPNRNVDSRYVSYIAVTRDGVTRTGLLGSESAGSITLVAQEGKQQTILRSDLEEIRGTGVSLMPVGLEKDLSKQNLADLIAYLAAIGPAPKQFASNNPEVVQEVDGRLKLLATNGAIYGDQIVFEEPFRNIGFWHGVNDRVVWTVEVSSESTFEIWLDWACDDSVEGNTFELSIVQDHGGITAINTIRAPTPGTGGWDRYRQQMIGKSGLRPGTSSVTFRPAGKSLNGALMDLRGIQFVAQGKKPDFPPVATADLPTGNDPVEIARAILNDRLAEPEREKLVATHLDRAAELTAALTLDLPADENEEYRRIPWIWRVAIGAGKKNETQPIKKLLRVALPKLKEPLRDWQAVVIGGGIINGLSLQGNWPGERIAELMKEDDDLERRWGQLLRQAAEMADNEKTRTGTRYDALRIIPLAGWNVSQEQLAKYLKSGTNDELQMGAISGLSDLDHPDVAQRLLAGLSGFSAGNRSLAIGALLRNDERKKELIDALERKQIKPTDLTDGQRQLLLKASDPDLKRRVERALKP